MVVLSHVRHLNQKLRLISLKHFQNVGEGVGDKLGRCLLELIFLTVISTISSWISNQKQGRITHYLTLFFDKM